MFSRVWAALVVLAFAGLVRLPHYDISWFGNDQIRFIAEARQILSGNWNVEGPLAAGLNIIGPLYSYFVAALLWIGGDAGFVALVHALCEVGAALLVYDAARRLSGLAAGVTAGVLYASAPSLIIGTRLIWNPGLLPAAVATGCWLLVRYCERPSTWRLVGVALLSGLTLTLHATGLFPSVAWAVTALLIKWPSTGQLAAALAAGALPLTPLLWRLLAAPSQGSDHAPLLAPHDVLETIAGIAKITLRFPMGAGGEHWAAWPSTIVLHLDAFVAAVGLAIGLTYKTRYRPVWLGLAAALGAQVVGAILYSGPLAWYYFTGPVAIVCLFVGHGISVWPRLRVGAAALVVSLSMLHVVFVYDFDRRAVEQGYIRIEGDGLTTRLPPGLGYGLTVRDLEHIGTTLRDTYSDGKTALRASHGFRAEMWRETDAEGFPRDRAPLGEWASEFVIVGNGATVVDPRARLIGDRVCVFDRPKDAVWKVWPAEVPEGWQLPGFADDRWYALPMPRRTAGSPSGSPAVPSLWRTTRQFFRGKFQVEQPAGPRLYVVSVHSPGNSQHWMLRFAVNGIDVPMVKGRVAPTTQYRNEEWVFDATGLLEEGENIIAWGLDGQQNVFDVDVFELPCLDREWYNADR